MTSEGSSRLHPLLLVLFIVLVKRISSNDCVNKVDWFIVIFKFATLANDTNH